MKNIIKFNIFNSISLYYNIIITIGNTNNKLTKSKFIDFYIKIQGKFESISLVYVTLYTYTSTHIQIYVNLYILCIH